MSTIDLNDVEEKTPAAGFSGRMVHTETMTFATWDVEAGASLPEHSHPHEQVVYVLEGELELVLEGKAHRLVPGKVLPIRGGQPHSARAITACRVLDVFQPVREDYR